MSLDGLVERWFSELTTKWLRRGTHRSVAELKDSINDWTRNWNHEPRPFVWHKSADDIFETMASYLQRIPTQDTRMDLLLVLGDGAAH